MIKLISIPTINISLTPLNLQPPTEHNTGGHKLILNDEIIYTYSPIDLTICGLTSIYLKQNNISDLSKWFIQNPYRIAESWITCTTTINKANSFIDSVITTLTISGWKILTKTNSILLGLFINNAPFTFRD